MSGFDDYLQKAVNEYTALKRERDDLLARVAGLEADRGIGDGDIRHALAERDRYREALERIESHWNGIDGEIDPTFMAETAIEALKP